MEVPVPNKVNENLFVLENSFVLARLLPPPLQAGLLATPRGVCIDI